jgi:hypothetical protein
MSDHPDIQRTFEERVARAREFQKKYNIPFEIYVDPWGDPFENAYQSWPDKYYHIDNSTNKILEKSEYNYGAQIMNDYSKILQELAYTEEKQKKEEVIDSIDFSTPKIT